MRGLRCGKSPDFCPSMQLFIMLIIFELATEFV